MLRQKTLRNLKIARRSQKERKAKAKFAEKTKEDKGSMNQKSPEYQSRQRSETLNGEKNQYRFTFKSMAAL